MQVIDMTGAPTTVPKGAKGLPEAVAQWCMCCGLARWKSVTGVNSAAGYSSFQNCPHDQPFSGLPISPSQG